MTYYLPPQKPRVWPYVLLGLVTLPIFMMVACSAMIGATTPSPSTPERITYQVMGDQSEATVSYETDGGRVTKTVALPWREDTRGAEGNVTATVGPDGGDILCRITDENGKTVSSNKVNGAGSTVSCNP